MISTTLAGGLGNQLFMYAMVRAMSLRNNVRMAFNTHSAFDHDLTFHRRLELHHFNLKLPPGFISTFDYPYGNYAMILSRKLGFNVLRPTCKYVHEQQHAMRYDLIQNRIKDIYLDGYWQSETYFADCKETIRKDFEIVTPMPHSVMKELATIQSLGHNTVMIGIRRYQEFKAAHTINNLVTEETYYNRAIEKVKSLIADPVFVVFCQDQEWARASICIDHAPTYFVEPKNDHLATIQDFFLMTQMQHFIISNSTYYWWAAYLARNDKKLVVAPEKSTMAKAICDGWVRV